MEKEYVFIVIAGILSGLWIFGGQIFINLGLSLFQLSFFIQLLVVIMLLPLIFFKKYRPKKGMNWLWIFYGLISALTILSEYGGLVLGVPVAIAVLLLYTQPLWTILITKLFMNEIITKRKIISVVLVLIGMVILVNPFSSGKIEHLSGVIVSLIGGISLSCWVIIASIVSKRNSHPVTTKFLNGLLTTFFLLLAYPLLVSFIKNPAITSFSFNIHISIWFWLVIFVLFAGIIGELFLFTGIRKVSASDAGIILLLEPVTAAILATIFLHQELTWNIIVGGLLILIANYLVVRKD